MLTLRPARRAPSARSYRARLRALPALDDVGDGELRAVAQVAEHLVVEPGAVLAGPETRWRGAYLVVAGTAAVASGARARLVGRGGALVASGGDEHVVAVTAMELVAIAGREWRALRALAPGFVRNVEARARTVTVPVTTPGTGVGTSVTSTPRRMAEPTTPSLRSGT
jgi:hypothetical protein